MHACAFSLDYCMLCVFSVSVAERATGDDSMISSHVSAVRTCSSIHSTCFVECRGRSCSWRWVYRRTKKHERAVLKSALSGVLRYKRWRSYIAGSSYLSLLHEVVYISTDRRARCGAMWCDVR